MTKLLSRAAALVFLAVLAACGSKPEPTPPFYRDLASPTARVDAATAAQFISTYRMQNGLGGLTLDPALQRAAEAQAGAMAAANDVNASRSAENNLKARLANAGTGEVYAVENVSAGYRTFAEAFSGWRESPKHNAVMLDARATRMGIATAYVPGSKYKVFWSLVLATDK
ncbi:CAP domain-containing protein [Stappia sp. F7233]|uniref:CAP domain-containing protein n=1 Tax=Stappia albiluteola TaxID=2758565 RepID=A0A839AHJ7_9HYPH|nr:CAP domain-containing protein [Stappia albiluteola]MBA5778556.1 CAP domain-containing protein [Stappia albiluteola]